MKPVKVKPEHKSLARYLKRYERTMPKKAMATAAHGYLAGYRNGLRASTAAHRAGKERG